jgi:hypothetical protein
MKSNYGSEGDVMDQSLSEGDTAAVRASRGSCAGDRGDSRGPEPRVHQCSLVVLFDNEAHSLGPLLTVQPSFTMSY